MGFVGTYNNIIPSINLGKNRFEVVRGIRTKNVEEIFNKNGVALFTAEKGDNTKTLFVAFKLKRNSDLWVWWCPTKEQYSLFYSINALYLKVDEENTKNRKW